MMFGIAQHFKLFGHHNVLQFQLLQTVIVAFPVLCLHIYQIVLVKVKLPIAAANNRIVLQVG